MGDRLTEEELADWEYDIAMRGHSRATGDERRMLRASAEIRASWAERDAARAEDVAFRKAIADACGCPCHSSSSEVLESLRAERDAAREALEKFRTIVGAAREWRQAAMALGTTHDFDRERDRISETCRAIYAALDALPKEE